MYTTKYGTRNSSLGVVTHSSASCVKYGNSVAARVEMKSGCVNYGTEMICSLQTDRSRQTRAD